MLSVVTRSLEINYCLRENKLDIVGLTERKLDHEINGINTGEGEYKVSRRQKRKKREEP